MPFKIQRVAQGLGPMLNLQGGDLPSELEDRVRPSIDLLQFYGLQQLQVDSVTTAAAAEGATAQIITSLKSWCVLFGCHLQVVKTATMTALRGELYIQRGTNLSLLAFAESLGPFGATETGNVVMGGRIDPLLCPPGSKITGLCSVIGTDLTANITVMAEFGTLG